MDVTPEHANAPSKGGEGTSFPINASGQIKNPPSRAQKRGSASDAESAKSGSEGSCPINPTGQIKSLWREEPDNLTVGESAKFVAVSALARYLTSPEDAVRRFLAALGIKLVRPAGTEKQYVLVYALESALFEMGLPESFKGGKTIVRAHQELAGVLYGALDSEVIRQRVKALARALGAKNASGGKSRKGAKRGDS